MPKLGEDKIEQTDLSEYLENESDFSFEMIVLHRLGEMGFSCEHGGTYEDPFTSKRREFDIRAKYNNDNKYFSMAAECKNIRVNFPLLASLVPRREGESFHDLVSYDNTSSHGRALFASERIRKQNSLFYPVDGMVAKKLDQVGRALNGKIVGNDSNTFDKLTQAANSAHDLVKSSCLRRGKAFFEFICPVLVVPDDRLWAVEYSTKGDQLGEPKKINACSLYLDQSWVIQNGLTSTSITLSHLDVVTYSHLEKYVKRIFDDVKGVFSGP